MANYVLILRGIEVAMADFSDQELAESQEQYLEWMESLKGQNKLIGDTRLISQGGRVLTRTNNKLVIDGPFAETKETVGGEFMLTPADYDEAIELAKDCPLLAHGGSSEVREIDLDEPLCSAVFGVHQLVELAS
ncbi:MAG: transcription initiation protein [Anaerolineae bacterium]|nr:transcription initiation protein [Anaerolineae bacterium]